MAYTRVWVNNTPPGAQAANTADDEIRNLRVDVEERMSTIVTGWSTGAPSDPIVAKPEILGNATKNRFFHHSIFTPDSYFEISSNLNSITRTSLYAQNNLAGTVTLTGTIDIPIGATITDTQFLVNRNGGSNITCRLLYNNFSTTPATTVVGSAVTAANGITNIVLSSGLPHVVATTRIYFADVALLTNSRLYGMLVQYSIPDCRNTL